MSYDPVILLEDVWKKYKLKINTRRTLREDIGKIFSNKTNSSLTDNEFWALQDINFSINRGESVGLYGPNGSGKTTIIKLLSYVTTPTRGEVTVKGKIAPLISVGAGFHPELTGRENIFTNASILGLSTKQTKQLIDEIIEFSELQDFIDAPVQTYSSGMRMRLGYAIVAHVKPLQSVHHLCIYMQRRNLVATE